MDDFKMEEIAQEFEGDVEMVDLLQRLENAKKLHVKAKECHQREELKRKNAEIAYKLKHRKYMHQKLQEQLPVLEEDTIKENKICNEEHQKRKEMERKTVDLERG